MPEKKEPVEVYLYCPECKKEVLVTASMYKVDNARASVYCDENGNCCIDWDNMRIEGDFEYVCEECDTELAWTLDEVEKKFKEEQKKANKKGKKK